VETLNTVVTHPHAYLLLVARTSGLFLLAPVIGSTAIPVMIRVALVLLTAWALFPIYALSAPPVVTEVPTLVVALGTELLVGLLVGLVAGLVFVTFQMAGSFIGTQMGFGAATLFFPLQEGHMSVVDQFYSLLGTLIFLVLNGHHMVLQAFDRTFRAVPLGAAIQANAAALPLGHLMSEVFVAALQLALPVLAALLLTEVAFGVIARAVPQINVFFMGLPLRVLIGLMALSLALPATMSAMGSQIEGSVRDMVSIVRVL
jgi:flagellar biosynthetic protein FliR